MDKLNKSKTRHTKHQEDAIRSNLQSNEPKIHKETNKLSEILRAVKKTSSMRLKGSRSSKVVSNKDLCDNNNSDDVTSGQTNMIQYGDVAAESDTVCADIDNPRSNKTVSDTSSTVMKTPGTDDNENPPHQNGKYYPIGSNNQEGNGANTFCVEVDTLIDIGDNISKDDSKCNINEIKETKIISDDTITHLPRIATTEKERNRKLSLDHTILLRGESFSQSEADLNAVGKLPLERKSSFFRKKMESFLKNTSEVFRRQSIKRKGSMSLQSLPEHCGMEGGISLASSQDDHSGSVTSHSSYCVAGSEKSLNSKTQPSLQREHITCEAEDQASFTGSQNSLASRQSELEPSDSIQSLNEAYHLNDYLSSRAQSVSSGLDTATHGSRRRKATNRANRVTWLASEGLTNYLRRIIQDEEGRKSQSTYQECSGDQECGSKLDSRGRRLSYQRAVSGEDPVRYLDSLRRPLIPEQPEPNPPQVKDLTTILLNFTQNGIPALKGFSLVPISDEALRLLRTIDAHTSFQEFFDWSQLSPREDQLQESIKELIITEVEYIKHLNTIVEVFIATAHALQDEGNLVGVDTARLFSNVPDILNVNLQFWDTTLYPVIAQADRTNTPFNTDLMYPGFHGFYELFQPYEKFISDHIKALEYLRSLDNNVEFQQYLSWCHSHSSCKRLQFSDIMVKPMQRLTKYTLMLHRMLSYMEEEPEKTTLLAMEALTKNCVIDINRSIRQREELEKFDDLIKTLDCFELINVRVFLLTDMLLICKKLHPKYHPLAYKIIRPKIMINKMIHDIKFGRTTKDGSYIIFLELDDTRSSRDCFTLSEPHKNDNPYLLKIWHLKIKEALRTYGLSVLYYQNPSRDISEAAESSSSACSARHERAGFRMQSDDVIIEREARERVATMLHRSAGISTDCDVSRASITSDSIDGSAGRAYGRSIRHPMFRTSTGGSSRNSRFSSLHHSISGASKEEPQGGPQNLYQAGTSVEHVIPPQHPEEESTLITVKIISDNNCKGVTYEGATSAHASEQSSPGRTLVMMGSPITSPTGRPLPPRAASRTAVSKSTVSKAAMAARPRTSSTLQVQPQQGVMALVQSLPDLTFSPSPCPSQCPSPQTASEKLFQSHQELLNRNRLTGSSGRYLSPDNRGTSYPPPSPTRALLKRSLAFCDSHKNPPLSKMGHVNSQSTVKSEPGPSNAPNIPSPPTESPDRYRIQINDLLEPPSSQELGQNSSCSDDEQAPPSNAPPLPPCLEQKKNSFFSSEGWQTVNGCRLMRWRTYSFNRLLRKGSTSPNPKEGD